MKSNYKRLGDYIEEVDIRNQQGQALELWGVSIDKKFIKSVANIIGTDLSKYKIISKNCFVCSLMQVSRDEKIPVARWNKETEAIVSPAYKVFKVKDEKRVLPNYIDLWFKRSEFDREASYYGVGGVRGSLEWEDFCDMKLPIPSIEEQSKIVDAYETIEKRIAIKKKINRNLENQAINNYQSMINNCSGKGKIGDYCDVKSGYAFKSDWWTDQGDKVVKIANIVEGAIDLDKCDCVSEENARKSALFFVSGGDLLIAMTGATTGKIGIVPYSKENITVNQRVGKFFLGNNPIKNLAFLYCTLLSRGVKEKLQPDGTAGSAQDNLSAEDIKNTEIRLPQKKEIDKFNELHEKHFNIIVKNNAEIRNLNKLLSIFLQTISVAK